MKNSPDGALIAAIMLPVKPRTKKNHSTIIHQGRRHILLPSKQYKDFEQLCKPHIQAAWTQAPIDFGISIEAAVYLDTKRAGDHCGYLQAIGDMLQAHGVVADDKWITWLVPPNGHWLRWDKATPRIELTIRRCKHPLESSN